MIRKSEYENGTYSTSNKENKLQLCRGMVISSAPADLSEIQKKVVLSDTMPPKFMIRCGRTRTTENPLIIVDGEPLAEEKTLSEINPNDIERIDILKNSAASAIYGYLAAKGVIVITTKNSKLQKFIFKDFLNSNGIAGATVSFVSANKRDTIMMAANDSGVVVTDKLKSSVNYQMSVSAVGYKSLSQNWKYSKYKEQIVMLERDVKVCDEVILIQITHSRTCRCGCRVRSIIVYPDKKVDSLKATMPSIFPNPAKRGKAITIKTTTQSDTPIEVRITSLDGKLVLSQPQKSYKGLNRISVNTDPRWAAGIYFVQLYANGKLVASDKVVIQ